MIVRLLTLLFLGSLPFFAFGQTTRTIVVDSTEIYFDFGKSQLRGDALDSLGNFVNRLPADSTIRLMIVAHTDSVGNSTANLKLSEKRALAIVNHLHESGIAPQKITWTFQGESNPQSSNDTEFGRQKNRRATVLVQQAESPLGYLKGRVLDEEGQPLDAEVSLKLKGKEAKTLRTDSVTGRFAIPFFKDELGLGVLEVYAKDHFFHSQVADLYKAPSLDIKVKLKETKTGDKLALNKLYFVGNQAVLLPPSVPELKRVLRFMQVNKHISIEIGGHVNHPFTAPEDLPPVSMELSINRAKVVYKYLIENGIKEDRMRFKGYGNSQMVYPRTRIESEMKKNRRVEITILSGGEASSVE